MSAYLVANYQITNPEGYNAYPPAVVPTIAAHGGEVVIADYNSEVIEGEPASVTVVVKFASKEAARSWYESDEYQEIIGHRSENSEGSLVFVDGFNPG